MSYDANPHYSCTPLFHVLYQFWIINLHPKRMQIVTCNDCIELIIFCVQAVDFLRKLSVWIDYVNWMFIWSIMDIWMMIGTDPKSISFLLSSCYFQHRCFHSSYLYFLHRHLHNLHNLRHDYKWFVMRLQYLLKLLKFLISNVAFSS